MASWAPLCASNYKKQPRRTYLLYSKGDYTTKSERIYIADFSKDKYFNGYQDIVVALRKTGLY